MVTMTCRKKILYCGFGLHVPRLMPRRNWKTCILVLFCPKAFVQNKENKEKWKRSKSTLTGSFMDPPPHPPTAAASGLVRDQSQVDSSITCCCGGRLHHRTTCRSAPTAAKVVVVVVTKTLHTIQWWTLIPATPICAHKTGSNKPVNMFHTNKFKNLKMSQWCNGDVL